MARILDFFLDRKNQRVCEQYADFQALFAGLGREETAAIQCLSTRISGSIAYLGRNYGLTDDDVEELICDCITLCIQKIRAGQYVFQGYDPATFVIEIAKNKVKNTSRAIRRHASTDLTAADDAIEIDESDQLKANAELLERLLSQIEPNCQNLIRLKYLEERRDKEVIEQRLTQYTTVDALKNHRSKCMKKLVEIGAAASLIQ